MRMSFIPTGGAGSQVAPRITFSELSVVALTHAVENEGRWLPVGAKGTVVAVYADGVGYEVEFEEPFPAVVTLEAGDLSG